MPSVSSTVSTNGVSGTLIANTNDATSQRTWPADTWRLDKNSGILTAKIHGDKWEYRSDETHTTSVPPEQLFYGLQKFYNFKTNASSVHPDWQPTGNETEFKMWQRLDKCREDGTTMELTLDPELGPHWRLVSSDPYWRKMKGDLTDRSGDGDGRSGVENGDFNP